MFISTMMTYTGNDIDIELLPVKVVDVAVPNEEIPPNLERHTYLMSASGRILTASIPVGWAKYMATKINMIKTNKPLAKTKLLCRIVAPIVPILKRDTKIITTDDEGNLAIKKNIEYARQVKKMDYGMRNFTTTNYKILPLKTQVRMEATFHVPQNYKGSLIELLAATEDLLYDAGYLSKQVFNIIKACDGCKVLYDDENKIEINLREY